jgi:hypothetical protein
MIAQLTLYIQQQPAVPITQGEQHGKSQNSSKEDQRQTGQGQ